MLWKVRQSRLIQLIILDIRFLCQLWNKMPPLGRGKGPAHGTLLPVKPSSFLISSRNMAQTTKFHFQGSFAPLRFDLVFIYRQWLVTSPTGTNTHRIKFNENAERFWSGSSPENALYLIHSTVHKRRNKKIHY